MDMNYTQKRYQASIEVKKSKFISYLVPVSTFKEEYAKLKKEHTKANHIVYAYRELNSFSQIVENSTDDGEPRGAAGMPTLNQLRGAQLINCAIITVRYFGGVKLGVGGMVRAYSLASKSVIESATIEPYERLIEYVITKEYNEQRQIEYYIKKLNLNVKRRNFLSDKVEWIVDITEDKLERLKDLLV